MTETAPTASTGTQDTSIMIEFHVDVVEGDIVEGFWFTDEKDMIIGVGRKLGVEKTEGLAEAIRRFPQSRAHAAEDPRDHTALIVAETEDGLRALVIAAADEAEGAGATR